MRKEQIKKFMKQFEQSAKEDPAIKEVMDKFTEEQLTNDGQVSSETLEKLFGLLEVKLKKDAKNEVQTRIQKQLG